MAQDSTQVETARSAAIADGLSTYLALSSGATELNPLINTSPPGLLLITGLKLGLVEAVTDSSLEPGSKARTLRGLSAIWGGASVNNILIALTGATPLAVVGGVFAGWQLWNRGQEAPAPAPPQESVATLP